MDLARLLAELSWVEWTAALLTLLNVWLVMRADIRSFPVGIVSVVLYAWVFWNSKLYANFALNLVYYLPMQGIGWYVWLRSGPQKDDDLPIRRLSLRENAGWLVLTAILTFAASAFLSIWTDGRVPVPDSFTTAASVVGQVLLTRKLMENWLYWLAVNLVYVPLLWSQQLFVSAGLYAILLVMAVQGFLKWRRAEGSVHA